MAELSYWYYAIFRRTLRQDLEICLFLVPTAGIYNHLSHLNFQDPRFNKDVDLKTGYRTHSILCMPILNYEGEVIGVAQIINKVTGNHEFTKQDEDVRIVWNPQALVSAIKFTPMKLYCGLHFITEKDIMES